MNIPLLGFWQILQVSYGTLLFIQTLLSQKTYPYVAQGSEFFNTSAVLDEPLIIIRYSFLVLLVIPVVVRGDVIITSIQLLMGIHGPIIGEYLGGYDSDTLYKIQDSNSS